MPCGWAGLVSETQMAQMVVMLGFTVGEKALWRGLGQTHVVQLGKLSLRWQWGVVPGPMAPCAWIHTVIQVPDKLQI